MERFTATAELGDDERWRTAFGEDGTPMRPIGRQNGPVNHHEADQYVPSYFTRGIIFPLT